MYLNGKKLFATFNNKKTIPHINATIVYITLTENTGKFIKIRGGNEQYGIDWGDGTIDFNTNDHNYSDYGSYAITVKGKLQYEIDIQSGYLKSGVFVTRNEMYSVGSAVKGVDLKTNNLGQGTFAYCRTLRSVKLSGHETQIPDYCFYNAGLQNVPMHEKIASIGDEAFAYCTFEEDIIIPSNVTQLGYQAFAYAGGNGFRANVKIEAVKDGSIVIPRDLGASMLFYNGLIGAIYLPNSISRIGSNFCNCEDVYYSGTRAEFYQIDKPSNWCGNNTTVHCSDGDI